MGVSKYKADDKTRHAIDEWIKGIDAKTLAPVSHRLQKRGFPTKAAANALLSEARREAREGRWWFDPPAPEPEPEPTVSDLWRAYEAVTKRENDSWKQDRSYSVHLLRHLGNVPVSSVGLAAVRRYREDRGVELTHRGTPPSPATLDREVEMLRRMINYEMALGDDGLLGELASNPLSGVPLLGKDNTRRVVVDEAMFRRLHDVASARLRPILVVAFDTGMRLREILGLQWEQIDLKDREIRLRAEDTKEERQRLVVLTQRAVEAIRAVPHRLGSPFVFSDKSGTKPQADVRKSFRSACEKAGIPCGGSDGLWFHDLRRSFVSRARRAGIPESVVMRMSGHRTREVFERYNIVDDRDLREAAKRLAEAARNLGEDSGEHSQGSGIRVDTEEATR